MCYYHATESFPHQQHAPSGTTTIVYDKIWWFQCWITAKRRCAVHPELQCSQSFIAVTILQSVHETSTITDHISCIILISKLSSRNIFHHSCSCLARTNPPSTSLLTVRPTTLDKTWHCVHKPNDIVSWSSSCWSLGTATLWHITLPISITLGWFDEIPSVIETVIDGMSTNWASEKEGWASNP